MNGTAVAVRRGRAYLLAKLLVCGLTMMTGCARPPSSSVYPPTPEYPAMAEESFAALIGEDMLLNAAVTMERSDPIAVNPRSINTITFAVFNIGNEPVTFPDQGFGISLFYFDAAQDRWLGIELPHRPNPISRTLPPGTSSWDFEVQNVWEILPEDVNILGREHLRVFVAGIGDLTGTRFGAFLDVTVLK